MRLDSARPHRRSGCTCYGRPLRQSCRCLGKRFLFGPLGHLLLETTFHNKGEAPKSAEGKTSVSKAFAKIKVAFQDINLSAGLSHWPAVIGRLSCTPTKYHHAGTQFTQVLSYLNATSADLLVAMPSYSNLPLNFAWNEPRVPRYVSPASSPFSIQKTTNVLRLYPGEKKA